MNLYIDDERKYCEAIFKDDELDLAIGRGGMNIKLASQLIEYRIDAFGEKEYEQRKIEQNTLLVEIPNFPKRAVKGLQEEGVNTISEFQTKNEDRLLEVKGITENVLEKIYDSIQNFIEKNRSDDEADDDNPDDIDVSKPEAAEDNSAIKPGKKEKTLIPQSKE
jgi:N utilization substance protein A